MHANSLSFAAVEKVVKKEEKKSGVLPTKKNTITQKTNKKTSSSILPPQVPNTPKIDEAVYSPCGSACQIIGDEITGQEKYLGGDCGSDGNIYELAYQQDQPGWDTWMRPQKC